VSLTARWITGRKRQELPLEDVNKVAVGTKNNKDSLAKAAVVKVGRETKGRRGKGVTTVSGVPLDEAALLDLAATLKQQCGTGGTAKDGRIEIQGDQRDRLATVLAAMGYQVKMVGG
jgi:translation initiation factor 1